MCKQVLEWKFMTPADLERVRYTLYTIWQENEGNRKNIIFYRDASW